MTFDPESPKAPDHENSKANAWRNEDRELVAVLFVAVGLALALA
jgi:hypothetical protein